MIFADSIANPHANVQNSVARAQRKVLMPPSRNTAEPSFGDWVCETVLLPTTTNGSWPPGMSLVRERPTLIPNYQRGISWGSEQVQDLVYSSSPVIGTVVLGKFSGPPSPYVAADAVGATREYEELADGLQRLSTGVALLHAINQKVLVNGAPAANYASRFSAIATRYAGLMGVVEHNDHQLRTHPRRAIKEQYEVFAKAVDAWIDKQLTPTTVGDFVNQFNKLMLVRPIALDRWDGFTTGLELMHTFLGINTVRVELGPVDLLRAHLVVAGTQDGWSDADIEAFENDFTEVFTTKGTNDSDLLPLVNAILKCIGPGGAPTAAFPTWGNLDKTNDVDPFLEFVLAFKNSSNNYLDQIRSIGAIPFAAVMAVHLRRFRASGVLPGFVVGGSGMTQSEEAELHGVLCGTLRSMLARKLGYESPLIVSCLTGAVATLEDAADKLSDDATGRTVATLVDLGWLKTALEGVDKKGARTVFNAMLLPSRTAGVKPAGGSFVPIRFGRGAANWAIDHLFPEAQLNDKVAGYPEGKRFRNLAPLPGAQNSSAKHAAPSVKLHSAVGTYYGHSSSVHPYCAWLVSDASARSAADLDSQLELQPNAPTGLGDARIDYVATELLTRI